MKALQPLTSPREDRGTTYILQTGARKEAPHLKTILDNHDGCEVVRELPLIDGMAVRFPSDSLDLVNKLKKMGVSVSRDRQMSIPEPPSMRKGEKVGPVTRLDVATPTLGLDKLHARGITGKGVTIAVIDTGIAPHPDLKDRIIGFFDLINQKEEAYDDNRHGTHCAGIAAGDGKNSNGLYIGAAPEAKLVGIKVLDKTGYGSDSQVIEGIQTAIEHKDELGIKVLSLSLGDKVTRPSKDDPVVQAVEKAVEAGLSVVVAAGNEGPRPGTIGTPGNAPSVITVGAADDRNTLTREDDIVSWFSSRGPVKFDKTVKPDVVAPGANIASASYDQNGYIRLSGTSMATPHVAGTLALLYQVKPDATPQEIKSALMETAEPLPSMPQKEPNVEGEGMINPAAAIERLKKNSETKKAN